MALSYDAFYTTDQTLKGSLMVQACPLLFRQIDATVVRIGSFFVMSLVLLFLASAQVGLLYLLSLDFVIRLYGEKRFSPVYQLSVGVQGIFGLRPLMADAGAKRLATQFGLLFLVSMIASHHLQLDALTVVVAVTFLSCVSLELLFGYCVGCKVYMVIKKFFPEY